MKHPFVLPSKMEKRIGRAQGATFFRSFYLADQRPTVVDYRDTLVHIEGTNPKELPDEFSWGIHGTRSIADASIYFSKASIDEGKLLYELDLWMFFDNLKESTTSVTEELVRSSGILSSGRMRADYEKEVKDIVLSYLEGRVTSKEYKAATELSLEWLLMKYPSAVWRFMRERPYVKAFVHYAMVRVAPKTNKREAVVAKLNVITFRPDPKKIVEAAVRQDNEIKITF
ncbi:hypothetical protein LJR290_007773 [Variovorax sp. LjRoot290]|uniref:hypothetical protein n=1 Tax=unclassified Variovorax TaxID=663243 RepID=UPI003ECC2A8B